MQAIAQCKKHEFLHRTPARKKAAGTDAQAFDLQTKYIELIFAFMGFENIRSIVVEPTLSKRQSKWPDCVCVIRVVNNVAGLSVFYIVGNVKIATFPTRRLQEAHLKFAATWG